MLSGGSNAIPNSTDDILIYRAHEPLQAPIPEFSIPRRATPTDIPTVSPAAHAFSLSRIPPCPRQLDRQTHLSTYRNAHFISPENFKPGSFLGETTSSPRDLLGNAPSQVGIFILLMLALGREANAMQICRAWAAPRLRIVHSCGQRCQPY